MEILIEKNNNYGLVVSSRTVAKELGKLHKNVIRDLEQILTSSDLSRLIIESNYTDRKGEMRKEYLLTKDGFTLYMFNIQGFQDFKIAYIQKFNEMEKQLKQPQTFVSDDWAIRKIYNNTLKISLIESRIKDLFDELDDIYSETENLIKLKKNYSPKNFMDFKDNNIKSISE